MVKLNPFHLAVPARELVQTRDFYNRVLGCTEGRSDSRWVDMNFFGHQLVLHMAEEEKNAEAAHSNPVDGHDVPVPHFGIVLGWDDWEELAERLQSQGIQFVIEPHIRFAGHAGEQATMFFEDPSGNALEFKAFRDPADLFRK